MLALQFRRRLPQYIQSRYAKPGKLQLPTAKTKRLVDSCFRVKTTTVVDELSGNATEKKFWDERDDTKDPVATELCKWLGNVPWEWTIREHMGHFIRKIHDMQTWMEKFAAQHPKTRGTKFYSLLPYSSSYTNCFITINGSSLHGICARTVKRTGWKLESVPLTQQSGPARRTFFVRNHHSLLRKVMLVAHFETRPHEGPVPKEAYDQLGWEARKPHSYRYFADQVMTDGYGASVLLTRPKTEEGPPPEKKRENLRSTELRSTGAKIGRTGACKLVEQEQPLVMQRVDGHSDTHPASSTELGCDEHHPQAPETPSGGPTQSATATFTLSPPPQLEYTSEAEAEKAIHLWTLQHGFNVTKKQLERNKNGEVIYRLFACDQWGKPKNTRRLQDNERVRPDRRSIRSGCPMRIKIVAVDSGNPSGRWKIQYTRDGSPIHNHEASRDVRVHVPHRQRAAKTVRQTQTQSVNELIFAHGAAGISTSKTYATLLHADEHTLVTTKDISNKKDGRRRKLLDSTSAIEALFAVLNEHKFRYAYETESSSTRLRYLIWAHPETLALARDYMDILVLDCTYKTNNHNYPLLNIIAVTGMNTILPIAQCWLPGEAEPDYKWALSSLKKMFIDTEVRLPRLIVTDRDLACMNATDVVFPSAAKLICRWHVNRNVEARVRRVLGEVILSKPDLFGRTKMNTHKTNAFLEEYHAAVHAETEEDFEACRRVLRQMDSSLADYLDSTWWRYKEKLVKCWTDTHLHYGCLDTSTVEGTHAKIKSWLDSSKGDLLTVFLKLLPWWKTAANSVSLDAQWDLSKVSYKLSDPTFSNVVKVITSHALTETHTVWKKAVKFVHDSFKTPGHPTQLKPCTGAFRRCYGRPCIHEMIRIYESDYSITLQPQDFDRHWWIRSEGLVQREGVMDPATRAKKRRASTKRQSHQAGHGANSTRRELSHFELPQGTVHDIPHMRESFVEMLQNDEILEGAYGLEAFNPPRNWGHAGLN